MIFVRVGQLFLFSKKELPCTLASLEGSLVLSQLWLGEFVGAHYITKFYSPYFFINIINDQERVF